MNILALGAHPDDIEYGCGGMLAKYAQRGHAVYMFVASDGALGGDSEVRRREQKDAARILGVREVFWGDYRDTEVPLSRELIARLESGSAGIATTPSTVATKFAKRQRSDRARSPPYSRRSSGGSARSCPGASWRTSNGASSVTE